MSSRREIVEAILFLPAMVVLAAVIFCGMYAIIKYGGFVLTSIYGALHYGLHLPHSAALALAVILTALTVYVTVPRAIGWIGGLVNRRKKLNKQ